MTPAPPAEQAWSGRRRRADLFVGIVVTLLVLGPLLLRRGFVLIGDMVFVPTQGWKDAWTGADGGVPRAVPGDAVVSVLSRVVGGELLQGLVLASILLFAWIGMTRLLGALPTAARWAGAFCFVWSPYVHERLAIGHWALLIGFAALPWVAESALRLRGCGGGERVRARAWGVLVLAFLAAGWMSPTGGVLTVVVAVVLLLPRWRTAGAALATGLALNLPWIVPAFLNGADQLAPDPFGAEAFAARADTPWGVLGSVFTFGGIWKESIHSVHRGLPLHASLGLAVAVIALLGLLLTRRRVLPLVPALALSAISLFLAAWGSFEPSRAALEWVVEVVPGGGLLRDAQKWVAGWVLVASTGFALAVQALGDRLRKVRLGTVVPALVVLPAVALPSLALGLGGLLSAHPYPDEWDQVRELMLEEQVGEETVVVLPFATYRRFDWTPRTVLDPAPRYFPGTVVTEDALTVPEGTVRGESALAARIRGARDPEQLAQVLSDDGVRWALVHLSTERVMLPAGATTVFDGEQIDLLRLREPTGEKSWEAGWRPWVYTGLDLLVLVASSIVVIRLFTCRNASLGRVDAAYTDVSC